ncbi:MAG: IS630 family transposase [Acidobacteriota bacterium]
MANKTRLPKLALTEQEKARLDELRKSRTGPVREVERARVLWLYHTGTSIAGIQRSVGVSRVTTYKCIRKTLEMGLEAGLKDTYHRPRPPTITDEAKSWLVNLACTKPKEHGYAAELWTRRQLAEHVRRLALKEGHACLQHASKSTIHRILDSYPLRPQKVKYYLEKRDPEFDAKMKEVLMVYQDVELRRQNGVSDTCNRVVTVSVDEKPGVQAIATTAPDLPPVPGKYPAIGRDYEYKRLGTVSILAAVDLQDGHVTARVERRHRSREFIALLKDLDTHYPPECTIRIILDNHSAHISEETRQYLSTRPNRFSYVDTPKYGSWLNLIETVFSKMARTFLRGIRVRSIDELKQRILLGISEINAAPVVHRWRKFEELASS